MMDRLTSMAVFVKAVDLGSFSAAADVLGMSGPMVGKHVRFLEERLGVRLINRTTRRQNLTDIGREYYERCRAVIAEAEAADALAADALAQPRGRLRVTAPIHFGRRCVAPVLLELAARYPSLELDLSLSDRLADLAEDGFDLAIRTGDLGGGSGLITRRVARQHMIVCAAPIYLQRRGRPESIEELGEHQAIVYRRSGRVRPWLFPQEGQSPVEVAPAHRFRFDDLEAIADAAAGGAGIAWLPSWLVRDHIEAGVLEQLLPERPGYLYDCHALWLPAPKLPPKLRLAIDALAAALPGLME